jgi:hypothetical protein
MFGRFVKGEFEGCPQNGYLSTGEPVSNVDVLIANTEEIRAREGYKPVVDAPVPETSEREYLEAAYTRDDTTIYRTWEVKTYGGEV